MNEWLLGGFWQDVDSSWVAMIRYRYRDNRLDVQYKSGVVCSYRADVGTASRMYQAESKGRFVHEELYHLGYEVIHE